MWERIQHADAAITDARAAQRREVKLRRDLAAAEARVAELDRDVARLEDRVDDELQDVERLEGGWYALLRRTLGDREDQLEVERREHAEAALRLDAARAEATSTRDRRDALAAAVADLGDPDADLEAARRDKAALLADLGDPRGEELGRLAEERGDAVADEREVVEAIEATEQAAAWLLEADAMLSKAADWGTWDMFGGGMMTSMAKQGRMRDARDAMQHAAAALRVLDDELADVAADVRDAPSLDTHGLTGMMDVFFDNIITDFTVQGRIRDARETVHGVRQQVAEVAQQLGHAARGLAERLDELDARRTALLDQPG